MQASETVAINSTPHPPSGVSSSRAAGRRPQTGSSGPPGVASINAVVPLITAPNTKKRLSAVIPAGAGRPSGVPCLPCLDQAHEAHPENQAGGEDQHEIDGAYAR